MQRGTEDALRALLESRGYKVKLPASLEGKSGIHHDFSLLAEKGGEKEVAIEVESSGRPTLISILSLYAKALDTNLDRLLLVTDAPMTEEAVRLAELYNIRVLPSGMSASDLEQRLEDLLSSEPTVLSASTALQTELERLRTTDRGPSRVVSVSVLEPKPW